MWETHEKPDKSGTLTDKEPISKMQKGRTECPKARDVNKNVKTGEIKPKTPNKIRSF